MISYAEALSVLRNRARAFPFPTEHVSTHEICGRIAATNISARECVPPFDNSAMDGFAIRSADVASAGPAVPVELTIVDVLAAGDGIPRSLKPGECMSIMTGAQIPDGCDAVIRLEEVEVTRWITGVVAAIRVHRAVPPGENVRRHGTDYRPGALLATRGDLLGPHHVLAMSAVGVRGAVVFRRPRALIVSTGSELAPADSTSLGAGQIRNSTGPMIQATLELMGMDVVDRLVVSDDLFLYQELVRRLRSDDRIDFVISTGAVSVGDFDFVRTALLAEGARIGFHQAAIRPGKPILFAELDREGNRPLFFFGVPGNPVSTTVGLRFFLNPFLREIDGRPPEIPLRLRLGKKTKKAAGLRCFFKAALLGESEESQVECLEGQASYLIHSLLLSQAWVVLPEEGDSRPAGEVVDVFRLFDDWKGGAT